MRIISLKLKFNIYASLCLALPVSFLYADGECSFYAKFKKIDTGYSVESASKSYIDEENVLLVTYNAESDKITSMKLPFENNKSCSLAYSNNGHNSVCSGDFINSNGTVAKNVFLTTITLGLGTLATGGVSGGSTNFNNIKLAIAHSDVNTSQYTSPIIQECKSELAQNRVNQKINARITEDENRRTYARLTLQQEEDQNWLNDMPKFRKSLKPGLNTNCGTIIELKKSVVHVQTGSEARDIWIPISSIYDQTDNQGRYVGCRDSNRWYKRYGNWVTGNNYYQNGTRYNDEV